MEKQKILVIGWTLGLKASLSLHSNGYDVLHIWRKKIQWIGEFILINGERYKTPPVSFNLPQSQHFDTIIVATKLIDTLECVDNLYTNGVTANYLATIENWLVNDKFRKFITDRYPESGPITVFEWNQLKKDGSTREIQSALLSHWWQSQASIFGKHLAKLFNDSPVSFVLSADIDNTRAWKSLLNSSINWLTAIYKLTVWEILDHDLHKQELLQLLNETYTVLQRKYTLGDRAETISKSLNIYRTIASHYTSTYQDIIGHSQSEIEHLNGYIIELWKQYNISTPHNLRVYDQVKKIEASYL